MTPHSPKSLISGAGIAGPALAYWLCQFGWDVTVIEKASYPRAGGYMLDVRSMACDVLKRMDLLSSVIAKACPIERAMVVNDHNDVVEGVHPHALHRALHGQHLSCMRGDLAMEIFKHAQKGVSYIFGDVIVAIKEEEHGVEVTFGKGGFSRFDCVIGADGENSAVRSIAFGEKSLYERHCGFYISAFTVPRPLVPLGTLIEYPVPGKRVTAYGIPGGKTVVEFVFREQRTLDFQPQDTATQRSILRDAFSRGDDQCSRLLREMDDATDFYLDAVSQIRMPSWYRGRVALIGDAACLASPLSGQGTSLALGSAYVLAKELQKTPKDPTAAFARYDRLFRPIAESIQRVTMRNAHILLPDTSIGLAFRNVLLRLLGKAPWIGRALVCLRGRNMTF